jgi:hypothetical protein
MKPSNRPYVICHMVPSVDGRIVTSRWGLSARVYAEYERTARTFEADSWMIGRVSMEPYAGKARVPARRSGKPIPRTDFIATRNPNGGVKEQVAGLYAQRLAEQGYITIAADAAYQGASGGQSRNVDKPAYRTEDIHGMADYIARYPGVDSARLGLFGICGGGGYSLKAAQTDKRFRAIATLSMFNSGRVRRNAETAPFREGLQALLEVASRETCAIMCAEAVWWRCHRRIVADHVLAHGVPVVHVSTRQRSEPAPLTPFAVVRTRARVSYHPGRVTLMRRRTLRTRRLSPSIVLEERPLELSRARKVRTRTDAPRTDSRPCPRMAQVCERTEFDLPVFGATVVEVALPIVST